jgi:NAD(P)-dependent dehydrogenase (short-subunit alcohol dehydrogenase family)
MSDTKAIKFDPSALLAGKRVVVIGGAGLLGSKICHAVVAAGARCLVVDINEEAAHRTAYDIYTETSGEKRMWTKASITDRDSIRDMIEYAKNTMGGIDCLINSSYPRNSSYGKKFEDVEYKDFCENINSHLGGYFLVSQQLLEYYRGAGGGCLLNMSSIYGCIAPRFSIYKGTTMTVPVEYAAIKSALAHLTKYMAKYYAGHNIRVNCISLGGLLDGQPESFLSSYRSYCLDKGMLEPMDVVGTVIFLASDMSRYINGQNICIDDGFTL